MRLLKPKLHIRSTKNIMILKQDEVIQNLTENAAQSNHSVVVRHIYWFALICFLIGTKVNNLKSIGANP